MFASRSQPALTTEMRAIPRTVLALGLVSLFMDVSSEIIHRLLPVFLVTVLGAGALSVGLIEGIAEAATPITKLFSGAISDWIGRRKPLILLGYGLAALHSHCFPSRPVSARCWLPALLIGSVRGFGVRHAML